MTRPPRSAPALALATSLLLGAHAGAQEQQPPPAGAPFGEARRLCDLEDERIVESSGLAPSRRVEGVFWTHNDSGDGPRLFAFDRQGRGRGAVTLEGASAIDWEDMASFQLDGRPFLLVADVGDNARLRGVYQLYVLPEPQLPADPGPEPVAVDVALTIPFRYPGGPRNCEAVAVDPRERRIYLATREEQDARSELFVLPLPAAAPSKPLEAEPLGELPLRRVTGMDLSPDGRRAVVITYSRAYLYARREGEGWGPAFARKPVEVKLPRRKQGESVCYDAAGGALYLTSEQRPTPLFELPPNEARSWY